MAQGCHLLFADTDRENFRLDPDLPPREAVIKEFFETYGQMASDPVYDDKIVTAGMRLDPERIAELKIGDRVREKFEERFGEMEEVDRRFIASILAVKTDRQAALIQGLGNPMILDAFAREVPSALRRIIEKHPDAAGLFEPAGPGATPWVETLKNSGNLNQANGCVWEVLATSRLMEPPVRELHIFDSDRIDFGYKFQARYGPRSGSIITHDGETAGFFRQPDRRTTEADLLIRPKNGDVIGVDFKYAGSPRKVEKSELEGLVVGLKTGELTHACLVCSNDFHSSTWKLVEELNIELKALDIEPIRLYERYA